LDEWNNKRQSIAKLYTDLLSDEKEIILPFSSNNYSHVFHLFVVRLNQRDKIKEALEKKGIETGVHYPIPLHFQPVYAYLKVILPVAEEACNKVLSLPIFPELTRQDVNFVCESIKNVLIEFNPRKHF
jgi:dTDP-4-amino-4,6-dideoxygalactose transaminase